MPRSAASAVRFDAGWDWTDPKSRADQLRDLAYYDWSLDEDFAAVAPRLRAVADPELHAPRRRSRSEDRLRPRRISGPEPGIRPVAAAPRTPAAALVPAPAPIPVAAAASFEPAPIIDAVEAPVIDPLTGRRTITITGRGAERGSPSRRPAALPTERVRHKPDRIAMWAVLLCVLMILAAATSAHAAMLH